MILHVWYCIICHDSAVIYRDDTSTLHEGCESSDCEIDDSLYGMCGIFKRLLPVPSFLHPVKEVLFLPAFVFCLSGTLPKSY